LKTKTGTPMRLGWRLACGLTVAFAALSIPPAASTGSSATTVDGQFGVSSLALGTQSFTSIFLASSEPVARVSVFVPQGYALDLGRSAGTKVASVIAFVGDVAGVSSPVFVDGEVVVDDPAKYASDAAAQACAPGTHAAVWRATLSVLGQPFDMPIFLDPAGGADPGAAAYALRLCPVWPPSSVSPSGLSTYALSLLVEGAINLPTAPGSYTWSAVVTPATERSVTPEPGRTFELRSIVPLPHTLTLRAKHDPKTKSVVLSGRLMAVGQAEVGVPISFAASTDSFSEFSFFGPVKTSASGEFSIRRRVERTTYFTASVDVEARPCTAPSTAPAGCLAETISPPRQASAIVVVRKATDPKLARRARDQALARSANLKLTDFPLGWEALTGIPVSQCAAFEPNLSDLTATGEAMSPVLVSDAAAAFSSSSLFLSEAQARAAFRREARLAAARCTADELMDDEDVSVLSVGPLSFPRLGNETRAFRIVASDDEGVGYIDLVSFRRGRVVVHIWFGSGGEPLSIEHELAAKVAARARGS